MRSAHSRNIQSGILLAPNAFLMLMDLRAASKSHSLIVMDNRKLPEMFEILY